MSMGYDGAGIGVVAKLRRLGAYLAINHSSFSAWTDGQAFIFYVNEIMDARMKALSEALDATDSGVPSWRFHDLFRAHAGFTRSIFSSMRKHPSYPSVVQDHPDFPALLSTIESSPDIPAVLQ